MATTTVLLVVSEGCVFCHELLKLWPFMEQVFADDPIRSLRIDLRKVNVRKSEPLPPEIRDAVRGFPSLLILHNGAVVRRHTLRGIPTHVFEYQSFMNWLVRYTIAAHFGAV
jgi:thiol-disulfide isomerase/thioredoxin